MKRTLPFLLAALLLLLAACQPAPEAGGNDSSLSPAPTGDPGVVLSPSPSPATTEGTPSPIPVPQQGENAGNEDVVLSPSPDGQRAPSLTPQTGRYFFLDGIFLGAWCDGTWYSAHENEFTLGQLFNCPYRDCLAGSVSSAQFYIGDGPGGYENFSEVSALLSPFGTVEDETLSLPLAASLTGEAAALAAPNYGFYVRFENTSHPLVSNAEISVLRLNETAGPMADDLALQLLEDAGISCDLDRVWRDCWLVDYDSDGEKEHLEFIRNRETAQGYANLEEGDPIFYALFLTDGDETAEVASCVIDHTTDLTAQFSLHNLMFLYDLNGDGVHEISFQHRGWEGGRSVVYTRTDSGWTPVLRANYGT